MITDQEWLKIKAEITKNIEPVFKKEGFQLDYPFEDIVDTLKVVLEQEIGDKDLDDREDILHALKIRYFEKQVDSYGSAVLILAIKLESFFKRIYKIINEPLWEGENNQLKGQIATFIRKFKFTYNDPLFINVDDNIFRKNNEFVATDINKQPLYNPEHFSSKMPLGRQFKFVYDLRNKEGHLDPETDDDYNSLAIKDLVSIYLFVIYKYSEKLKKKVEHNPPLNKVSNWNIFTTLCRNFDKRQAYFLIIDKFYLPSDQLITFSEVKWDFVFDLDTNSDVDGIYKAVKSSVNQSINQIIHRNDDLNKMPSFPDNTTFWYYAKGLEGIQKSLLKTDTYNDWRTLYGNYTTKLLEAYYEENFGRKSTTINVIIFSRQSEFVEPIIYAIKDMDSKLKIRFIFANEDNTKCKKLINQIGGESVDIPLAQVLDGFRLNSRNKGGISNDILVPCLSSKGASIIIPHSVAQALNQYFKIIHLNILQDQEVIDSDKSFYQGRVINWRELDNSYDVPRIITKDISNSLKSWLQSRSDSGIFTLVHHPGSGGTTVARRVAYSLYTEYPVLLLNESISNFDEAKIVDRLHELFTLTEIPALVVIDNSNISKAQIENLKRNTEHRLAKAIFLFVDSAFLVPRSEENLFYLKSELDANEVDRFVHKFSKEFSNKSDAIKEIQNDFNPAQLTPFYFGLVANAENFINIEKYVSARLSGLSSKEIDLLLLLAFCNQYASGKMREVPHFVISGFLEIEEEFILLQNHIDNPKILDLIIETEPDQHIYWKTIHPIISKQILKNILGFNDQDKIDPFTLKDLSIRIIKSFREISNLRNSEVLQLLYSLFIQRNDSYYGEEEELMKDLYNERLFSSLINDLQTNQNRIEVFKVLTEQFPTEHSHFWGHFSRIYSIDKDFNMAHMAIEKALNITDDDYRLYHIKGMSFRTELYRLMDKFFGKSKEVSEELFVKIKGYFDEAEEVFIQTREVAPYTEHGYVSYVQMVIQTIEFGYSISPFRSPSKDFTSFITHPNNNWFRGMLSNAKEVIDDFIIKNPENKSTKLEQYQITLFRFWGEKEKMLNSWQALIGNKNFDQNLVRRQLAYAYLAKSGFSWNQIKGKDVLRIQALAEENLQNSFEVRDVQLWFEASRRLDTNILNLIGRLEQLEFKKESVESAYYLMCLYTLKALTGGGESSYDNYLKYQRNVKTRINIPYSKVFCPEWISMKDGKIFLINNKEVGKWDREKQFFDDSNYLKLYKITGRVVKYNRPQEGFIELENCGIWAIYQPAKYGHYGSDVEKATKVECYVGFNYDGARAFLVKNI